MGGPLKPQLHICFLRVLYNKARSHILGSKLLANIERLQLGGGGCQEGLRGRGWTEEVVLSSGSRVIFATDHHPPDPCHLTTEMRTVIRVSP